MIKRKSNRDFLQMIPGGLLVLALIAIVFGNGIASNRTTEAQAKSYLEQFSRRSAEELEKNFVRQEENIQTMAHMTAHIMEYERIDTAKLIHLTENSSFDGIEYIHGSGKCYGMNEQSWSVADLAYFQDAMQQNVGYAYDAAPERSEEGCIVFYAPILSDEGKFDGILVGYMLEENIAGMLDVSFWGHETTQYLCMPDGTIVATNHGGQSGGNILEHYSECDCMTDGECEKLSEILKAQNGNFKYSVNDKTELGSVCAVDGGKFLLVETFPPEVLSELTSPMDDKMHLAFLHVVVSLSAYSIIMFLIGRKTKRRLQAENDKVNELLKGAEGLANQDGLTGLYNRRGLMEIIGHQKLEEKQGAFMIMDIDHFKQINDTYGHQVGDELLVKLSGLLKETFRSEDILVRIGGDEFVIIMPKLRLDQSKVIKQKIESMNEKLQNPTDQLPAVSVSAGVAFSRPGEFEGVYKRADQALYEMKAKGRCGCCIYEEMERG